MAMTMYEAACFYGDFSMFKQMIAEELSEKVECTTTYHDFDEHCTTLAGMTVTETYINLDLPQPD